MKLRLPKIKLLLQKHRMAQFAKNIFSPLCTRRHKIWPSLFFFMSKQIINGSIFRPTLRKANFAVSNQKSKNLFFKIMMSWYLLNVASDWWYLILKYYSRSAEDARVNFYELKDGPEVSASHVMEMGRWFISQITEQMSGPEIS